MSPALPTLPATALPSYVQPLPHGVYAIDAIVDGAVHPAVANLGVRPTFAGSTRRSTTFPFFRWDSTISSISSISTKVYQTASG